MLAQILAQVSDTERFLLAAAVFAVVAGGGMIVLRRRLDNDEAQQTQQIEEPRQEAEPESEPEAPAKETVPEVKAAPASAPVVAAESPVAVAEQPAPAAKPVVTAGAERRQSNRSRRWLKVVLADETEEMCVDAWLTDCSARGVGILVFQEIPEGNILRIRPAAAGEAVPWTRVEARFCRHLEKNTWSAGCMFLDKPQWGSMLVCQ
jgi:hypothetical protein